MELIINLGVLERPAQITNLGLYFDQFPGRVRVVLGQGAGELGSVGAEILLNSDRC
jgi:hypothetical protein